ncbi:response regulator [Stappia sp. GBMRC 2046]|uniref:Response regulator n=1 Tax=Stappia sediminis TaxID=2692190 RepID=A0A7X3LRS0_9HYPH|nr:response regulator [Stappia sediminis]MXN63888.1 response regulator [Stappia sediminis]
MNYLRVDLSKITAMIVDDNVHMRKILHTVLDGLGLREIVEAEDGIEAWEMFQKIGPDIVLLDWRMPFLNGAELTRMIRKSPRPGCFVPIIAVTAYSEKRHIIAARDAGVSEVLCKPISTKGLYLRIANCVLNQRDFIRTKTFFGPDRRRFRATDYTGEERRGGPMVDQYELDQPGQIRRTGTR